MARAQDPTDPIRMKPLSFPGVTEGTSCNQSSFKAGKGSLLFMGPGAKGQGFKAMFKLERFIPQASKLAAEDSSRIQIGSNGWVTTRFTTEKPLPKSIWEKWLKESYELTCDSGTKTKRTTATKTANKKTTRKKATRRR